MDYQEFLDSTAYDNFADLSATSVALCLSAITLIALRENWEDNGNALTDAQWDNIQNIIALANLELMSSLVGAILPHVMSTISAFKMLPCDGATYNKSDYPLLYDAIDPIYIISGTQFRVPDMVDKMPVSTGGIYALDSSGGAPDVTLSISQIPAHTHGYDRPISGIDVEGAGIPDPFAVGLPYVPLQTGSAGGGLEHENMPPYRAVNWAIIAG